MVKKLFKHEFAAYLRVVLPIYAILMIMAVCGRILQFFESPHILYRIAEGSSSLLFVVAVYVSLLFVGIYAIIRFYVNMFTGQGYLSFSLPVTPTQHILVKSLTALSVSIITMTVTGLACCIITKGPLFIEFIKAIHYTLFDLMWEEFGIHGLFYVIEFLLYYLVAFFAMYMIYYSCLTIGQLAKRNRILLSIGVFVGYYIIGQVAYTILVLAFVAFQFILPVDAIINWCAANQIFAIHLGLITLLLMTAVGAIIFFIINRIIITHRLNLE